MVIDNHLFCEQEPETIRLGSSLRYQQSGSSRRLVEVTDTFQYVPLIPNLKHFLSNPDVFKEVITKSLLVYVAMLSRNVLQGENSNYL